VGGGGDWVTVALAVVNVVQIVLLAWIRERQVKAARLVSELNGSVERAVRELAPGTTKGPASAEPPDV
jgi:hypothetical protein